MKTIDTKIKEYKRWKKAENSLKKFNEIIKVVKKYPLKPITKQPPLPPYTKNETIKRYNSPKYIFPIQ